MSEASPKSEQKSLWDTPDVTSSPALQDGSTPLPSPAGRKVKKSGRAHAPASPSVQPASGKAKRTKGISGPLFTPSSPSGDLQRFLESRLRQLMDVTGSLEFGLTWKVLDMPSEPSICQLRASGHRTSDSGSSGLPHGWARPAVRDGKGANTLSRDDRHGRPDDQLANQVVHFAGWPTAKTTDADKGIRSEEGAAAEFERKGLGADLPTVAMLAGWPTPMAGNTGTEEYNAAGNNDSSRKTVELAGWATPRATDQTSNKESEESRSARGSSASVNLPQMVTLTGWSSPRVPNGGRTTGTLRGDNGKPRSNLETEILGAISTSSPAGTANSVALDAAFSRWLMGFPQSGLIHGWDTSSPGWRAWVIVQRILDELSRQPVETASGDSAVTETQS